MTIPECLQEPDAILLRKGKELDEWLKRYTVPLIFFRGEIEARNINGSGSGVLLKIGGSRFILSAGHCVRDWQNSGCLVVGIASSKHTFSPRVYSSGYSIVDGCEDFGFFELYPEDASTIESQSKIFISPSRVKVFTVEELIQLDDWMVVSGYPREYFEPVGEVMDPNGHMIRHLHVASTIFGGSTCPTDFTPLPPACGVSIDVWVPEHGNLDTTSGTFQEIEPPELAGMSGGSCWLAGVRPNPEAWEPNQMQLVAIHIGTFPELFSASEKNRLIREVLIGNHLRLIAEKLPHLREEICANWPSLMPSQFQSPNLWA